MVLRRCCDLVSHVGRFHPLDDHEISVEDDTVSSMCYQRGRATSKLYLSQASFETSSTLRWHNKK
jgi:hypothetical protein